MTATATPTTVATNTPKPTEPPQGIIYALSPDINSVGWIQSGEAGNHFGESYMYTGIREGNQSHGAMQFDLSFIPAGATIFLAELDLTGLEDKGLTADSNFVINILEKEIDPEWSRHDYRLIHEAVVDEPLTPALEAKELGAGKTNKFVFNAAQRSIIEDRLQSNFISFRIDGLHPEGWFAWDSGHGEESQGFAPILRLGVLPPPVEVAEEAGPTSTSTPSPTFVIVTSTPTPENILTAAAIAPALTLEATTTGTPTPLPPNWVTPWAVTPSPVPQNEATAQAMLMEATAIIIAFGPSTPTPQNMVTTTPTPTATPTPIFILMEGELPPVLPTPTSSITPQPTPAIPPQLIGKIAFKSDRTGREEIYVINADGTGLALLTNRWPYNVARFAETFSPDGRFRVFTKQAIRYAGDKESGVTRFDAPALYWYDTEFKQEKQLTNFGIGLAYDGVWSPSSNQITFVSNDSGDDEVWVVNHDGTGIQRLTETNEAFNAQHIGKDDFVPEINKHPSWSPDGKQIVFWSTRTGHAQIWVMNVDGSNLYSLSRTGFADWDPVWIKYPGVPANAQRIHIPYTGPHDPYGPDRNCTDFTNKDTAQAFYLAAGGPAVDPHDLDSDQDGVACSGSS